MLKPINTNRRLSVKSFRMFADSVNATTEALLESLEEYDVDGADADEYEIFIFERDGTIRIGVLAPEELAATPEIMGPAALYANGRWYYSARFRLFYPTTEA